MQWSAAMKSRLAALFRRGLTGPQIVVAMGVSETSVRSAKRRLGLEAQIGPPSSPGPDSPVDWSAVDWSSTDGDLAQQLGVNRKSVWTARRKQGLPPSNGHAKRREMQAVNKCRAAILGLSPDMSSRVIAILAKEFAAK